MKNRGEDDARVLFLITVILLLAVAVFTSIFALFRNFIISSAKGEDAEPELTAGYIICMPGDYVNVRPFPNKKQEPIGRFEAGEPVWLDGKRSGAYAHCVNLRLEDTEGWIHAGYIVSSPVEAVNREGRITARGRVAVRKNIGGDRTKWVKPGTEVQVYYWTNEWCLTNRGYIMSEYIEINYGEDESEEW